MKIAAVLVLIAGYSLAIPIEHGEDRLRTKKSTSYGAPCSGGGQLAPVALYLASAPQPQYREPEAANEEHARSQYGPGVGAAGYGGNSYSGSRGGYGASGGYSAPAAVSGLAQAGYPSHVPLAGASPAYGAGASVGVGGPAVGLFPNAKVGGCNVPLLLSCAPNVVAGHLAESHGYSAPAYRNFEEDFMREADWMKQAREASHHTISQDYPEPNQGSHHTISKDYPEPNLTRVVPVQHHHSDQNVHDGKHKD